MARDGAAEGPALGRMRGIVIGTGAPREPGRPVPRIAAFVWGGKVQPAPTLPFGRWKTAA